MARQHTAPNGPNGPNGRLTVSVRRKPLATTGISPLTNTPNALEDTYIQENTPLSTTMGIHLSL